MPTLSSRADERVTGRVVVVAPDRALDPLAPLLDVYRERGPLELVPWEDGIDGIGLGRLADGAAAVLLVAPRRRSPRTLAPGVAVEARDGRRVPVGMVPDLGHEAVRRFADAAAEVHRRPPMQGSVALLAQRSPRYRDLAGRLRRVLGERTAATSVSWWTADEVVRDDLVAALGLGFGLGLYVGHGRPVGWVGYRGVRAHHLIEPAAPIGAMVSLACLTASRRRTGLSFSEALVMQGSAAAALGAVGKTLHLDNARWALGIARGLAEGATTIGELVTAAGPSPDGGYRILGDPLAPLRDAPGARQAAQAFEAAVMFPARSAAAS
jgi:hypothetical protein